MTTNNAQQLTINTLPLYLQCNQIRVEICCNHAPLLEQIAEHTRPLVVKRLSGEAEICISINLWEAERKEFPLLRLAEDPKAVQVGKRLFRVHGGLLWSDLIRAKNMALFCRLNEHQLCLEYDYYLELPAKKLERNPDYRYEKYFSLTKYFFYFPLIWYQEQFARRYLLHASGVELNELGVALGGVGGVGKTTTCVGLLSRGARLLSENLLFYDREYFYPLYEPIRLDDRSVVLLNEKHEAIFPAALPEGARAKQLFHIHPRCRAESAPAGLIILPEFAPRGGSERLAAQSALALLENYNQLTREINDYYWYAATLNLLRPEQLPARERLLCLEKLIARAPVYRLYIDRSKGVEPVIDEIYHLTAKLSC